MPALNFFAMGCTMRAVLAEDTPGAAAALAAVPQWFTEWERALSRFDPNSELSQLNAAPGQWVRVSETLWDVVQAAWRAVELSAGWVRPDLLPALEAAGYRESFATLTVPEAQPLISTLADWRTVGVDHAQRALRLPFGVRLDVGGVAKGWCADLAAQRLSAFGPALVDAGGDIALSGAPEPGWPIALALPTPQPQLQLCLGSGGVATSGRDYRQWHTTDGAAQHHLIDPHTHQPAQTDVLTATVIAASAYEAEIAAKVALLRGSVAGLRWLAAHGLPGALYLVNGALRTTLDFGLYVWPEAKVLSHPV